MNILDIGPRHAFVAGDCRTTAVESDGGQHYIDGVRRTVPMGATGWATSGGWYDAALFGLSYLEDREPGDVGLWDTLLAEMATRGLVQPPEYVPTPYTCFEAVGFDGDGLIFTRAHIPGQSWAPQRVEKRIVHVHPPGWYDPAALFERTYGELERLEHPADRLASIARRFAEVSREVPTVGPVLQVGIILDTPQGWQRLWLEAPPQWVADASPAEIAERAGPLPGPITDFRPVEVEPWR